MNNMSIASSYLASQPKVNKIEPSRDQTNWKDEFDQAIHQEVKAVESKKTPQKGESAIQQSKKALNKKESICEIMPQGDEGLIEKVQEINLEIIQILMQQLNLTEEDIQHVLKQMDKTPMDLLTIENFKVFINQALAIDEKALLESTVPIKDISKLFKALEAIREEIPEDQLKSLMQVKPEQTIEVTTKHRIETTNNGQITTQVAEEVQVQQVQQAQPGQVTKQTIIRHKETITTAEKSGIQLNQTMELGVELPIQMTLETQKNMLHNQKLSPLLMQQNLKSESIPFQMLEKLEINALLEKNEITMELSPKTLGKLSIKVSESQGIIMAHIKVDNEKAKEALLQDLSILKEGLENQGLKVGDFQVDVRERFNQSAMEQQKQKSSKRIEEILNKQLEELSDEDEKTVKLDLEGESEINLMA